MVLSLTALITKVVLPVMFGAMILLGLQTIKVESLDPNVNDARDAIGSMGPTDVTIGKDVEPDVAEKQFRETMVFNILGAQNCDLIGLIEDETLMQGADSFQSMGDGAKYHFDNFDNIKELGTEFFCAGASNTIDVIDAPEVIDQEWASQQGHDMEGVLGRIKFNISQSFVIEDPRLLGINLPPEKDSLGQISQPDFWNGDRMSVMMPPGITSCGGRYSRMIYPGEDDIAGRDQGSNDGARMSEAEMYAYRLRMVNIPIVKEEFREYNEALGCQTSSSNSQTTLNRFLFGSDPARPKDPSDSDGEAAAKYVLCKGADGYVQSNAGSIDNTGEADADNPRPEDVVYPKLELTDDAESCMKISESKVDLSQTSLDDTECSTQNSVKEIEIGSDFYIGKVNDEEHFFDIRCGFQEAEVETKDDSIMGGSIEYYVPVPTSQQCEYRTYDIKERPFRNSDGEVEYPGERTDDGQLIFGGDSSQEYDLDKMDIQEIKISFEKNSGSDSVQLSSELLDLEGEGAGSFVPLSDYRAALDESEGSDGAAQFSLGSVYSEEVDYPDGDYTLQWTLEFGSVGLKEGSNWLVRKNDPRLQVEPESMSLEVNSGDGEIIINSVEIRGRPDACAE